MIRQDEGRGRKPSVKPSAGVDAVSRSDSRQEKKENNITTTESLILAQDER